MLHKCKQYWSYVLLNRSEFKPVPIVSGVPGVEELKWKVAVRNLNMPSLHRAGCCALTRFLTLKRVARWQPGSWGSLSSMPVAPNEGRKTPVRCIYKAHQSWVWILTPQHFSFVTLNKSLNFFGLYSCPRMGKKLPVLLNCISGITYKWSAVSGTW